MEDRFPAVLENFRTQADYCRKAGSLFYADLLVQLSEVFSRDTAIGQVFSNWPSEPKHDAVALRFVAALNYLAITEKDTSLAKLFPPNLNKTGRAVEEKLGQIINRHKSVILDYLKSPPQTNEVGRSMVLLGGFLEVAKQFGQDMDIFEVGASAGLNMAFDQYYYQTAEWSWGNAESKVQFQPNWQGRPPPNAVINVRNRIGCDQSPVNAAIDKNRLLSYIWPDQYERVNRISGAIDYAIETRPIIDEMDAVAWLKGHDEIATKQRPRVIYHSIVWQYFSEKLRREFCDTIFAMGQQASSFSPLIWLRLEPAETDQHAGLRMTVWPDQAEFHLADSGFHGEWIRWYGSD